MWKGWEPESDIDVGFQLITVEAIDTAYLTQAQQGGVIIPKGLRKKKIASIGD